ncbi:hypothetical protein QTN47_02535 [Danxiaibacter flavus]|uniref:YD repeat-containing protein n=1 Tax=Danxiaibacter flavus TaxID=3049108 RepID=A0ABV3Z9Z5_9BACT|nr:hypothetical protein QNM32_02535 [Chitinophagaceae bacterium DXS]
MNKSILGYALALIVTLSSTSCKKLIDFVNHPPSQAGTSGCKVVSTTEMVRFYIFENGAACGYGPDCVKDIVALPVVYKVYYNAQGNPDSITWKPFGVDTVAQAQPQNHGGFRNRYFKYDAQGRLIAYVTKGSYSTAPISSLNWENYTYPDAHTMKVNGTGTIKLDDSMRVISDVTRTFEYDSNGNLELNPANEFQSNEYMSQVWGDNQRLTYSLDKKTPRQLNWVFMFIDRDFSKNASNELWFNFNSNGYPEEMDGDGPNANYLPGYQEILFGAYSNILSYEELMGHHSIQYACTETPPSKK